MAIAHIVDARGSGGIDTVSRWMSLVLATLVAMLSTFGYLLRRAHHRALPNISTENAAGSLYAHRAELDPWA